MEQATLATMQSPALGGPGLDPAPSRRPHQTASFTLFFQLLTAFLLFAATTCFVIDETATFTVYMAGLLAYLFACYRYNSAGVPPSINSLPFNLIWLLPTFTGDIFGRHTSRIVDIYLISLSSYYAITGKMAEARETLKQALAKAAIDGISNILPEVVKSGFAFLSGATEGGFAFLSDATKSDNSFPKHLLYCGFACFCIVITCLMAIYFAGGRRIIEQTLQNATDIIKLQITNDNPEPPTADHTPHNMPENAEHDA